MFKKLLAVALVLAVVFSFAGCGKKSYTEANAEYVLGVSGPLTGGAAVYGVAVANALPALLSEADFISTDNNSHSISTVIYGIENKIIEI